MRGKISEMLVFVLGFIAQNITSQKTTAFVDVTGARKVAVNVVSDDNAAEQTVSIQWRAAKDAAGLDAVDLGDPITVTALSTGKFSVTGDVEVAGLPDGYTHLAAQVTETGSPAAIASATATLILGENRFNP